MANKGLFEENGHFENKNSLKKSTGIPIIFVALKAYF
jgi:hypothetical protein